MHMRGESGGYLSMSESVTLLPPPKDIKIGVGAAFIKAHGAHAAFRVAQTLTCEWWVGGVRGGVGSGIVLVTGCVWRGFRREQQAGKDSQSLTWLRLKCKVHSLNVNLVLNFVAKSHSCIPTKSPFELLFCTVSLLVHLFCYIYTSIAFFGL